METLWCRICHGFTSLSCSHIVVWVDVGKDSILNSVATLLCAQSESRFSLDMYPTMSHLSRIHFKALYGTRMPRLLQRCSHTSIFNLILFDTLIIRCHWYSQRTESNQVVVLVRGSSKVRRPVTKVILAICSSYNSQSCQSASQ